MHGMRKGGGKEGRKGGRKGRNDGAMERKTNSSSDYQAAWFAGGVSLLWAITSSLHSLPPSLLSLLRCWA